jgi:hypothetical protein
MNDEPALSGRVADPRAMGSTMTDDDLASLREKLPFLTDFRASFVRSRPRESLLKLEAASTKIREMETT